MQLYSSNICDNNIRGVNCKLYKYYLHHAMQTLKESINILLFSKLRELMSFAASSPEVHVDITMTTKLNCSNKDTLLYIVPLH